MIHIFLLFLIFLLSSLLVILFLPAPGFNVSFTSNQTYGHQSNCGVVLDIKYPFRFGGDSEVSGRLDYPLRCEHNRTVLQLGSNKYLVEAINYQERIIRITDPGLHKDNCSTFPEHSLRETDYQPLYTSTSDNLIVFLICKSPVKSPNYVDSAPCITAKEISGSVMHSREENAYSYALVGKNLVASDIEDSCSIYRIFPSSSDSSNINFSDIHNVLASGFDLRWTLPDPISDSEYFGFVNFIGKLILISLIDNFGLKLETFNSLFMCSATWWQSHTKDFLEGDNYFHVPGVDHIMCTYIYCVCVLLPLQCRLSTYFTSFLPFMVINLIKLLGIKKEMAEVLRGSGDERYWRFFASISPLAAFLVLVIFVASLVIAARAVLGIIALIVFLIRKWRRMHLSAYDNIEEFLQSQNNFMPIRYSYKEILKMTNNFKDKLGKGGYGDVYKGKSRSGLLVAIKMLNEVKGTTGQDFINEVATIGRIYHINVVRLVGFCATASKRALVYDYMPNGSLDKFIFLEHPGGIPLSWERAHQIAVGVARGIAYLHQGCNMQILHFDIKPHNVLLDENFVPKISDFGLAKLCPRKKNTITLTAVKGTLGYMAPELIYRKIGGVSYKADVYSFGQLLLAVVGRRKVNTLADHSSQVYFSSWIYEKVNSGEEEDLDLGDITEDEKDLVRKIILVALWCVQWTPANRPSMPEVLEMLEGDLKNLKLPPKPLYYPQDSSVREQSSNQDTGDSTFPLCESIALEIAHSD